MKHDPSKPSLGLRYPKRLHRADFRLLRHLSPIDNRRRLDVFVERFWQTPDMQRWLKKHRLWKRARAASAKQGGARV